MTITTVAPPTRPTSVGLARAFVTGGVIGALRPLLAEDPAPGPPEGGPGGGPAGARGSRARRRAVCGGGRGPG
ncbi:hypothetical protein ACWDDN_48130, partial [Streptomyces griseoruber]